MNSRRLLLVGWITFTAVLVTLAYLWGRRTARDEAAPPLLRPAGDVSGLPAAGYSTAMIDPTAPAALERPIMPWEPHQALVLAMVPEFLREDARRFDLYMQVIRAAVDYVDVIILVPERRSDVESRVLDRLSQDPQNAAIRSRVHFVTSSINSGWVRDYLPQYALDRSGRLALIDPRTIDVTSEPAFFLRSREADRAERGGFERHVADLLGDDLAPAYLGSFLRSEFGYAVRAVRPPLALAGGDFVPLGRDDVAVSQSTLRYHGGQDDVFRDLLRRYFGFRRVHILPTLPGRTVDHLDFLMQGVSDRIVLAARPPRLPRLKQLYATRIGELAAAVIQRNLDHLRQHLPRQRIIEVPMPPPLVATTEEIHAEIREMIETRICERYNIDASALDRPPAATAFRQALTQSLGLTSLDRPEDLDRAARAVLGESLAVLERLHVDRHSVYRTYLNSTVIHAPDGRTLVLLPRYAPRNAEEAAIFPALEEEVLAAYREALPSARLQWIECDSIIAELGALHCITHLVPRVKPRPDDPAQ